MIPLHEPPALETRCAECGEPFTRTAEMLEVGDGIYVHAHDCEGWSLDATVSAPLVVFAAVLGFGGGVLLFEALGWLRDGAVVLACVACVALAWEMWRGRS